MYNGRTPWAYINKKNELSALSLTVLKARSRLAKMTYHYIWAITSNGHGDVSGKRLYPRWRAYTCCLESESSLASQFGVD
jgi:hypothetical protein